MPLSILVSGAGMHTGTMMSIRPRLGASLIPPALPVVS
jgi:hypothetical protein